MSWHSTTIPLQNECGVQIVQLCIVSAWYWIWNVSVEYPEDEEALIVQLTVWASSISKVLDAPSRNLEQSTSKIFILSWKILGMLKFWCRNSSLDDWARQHSLKDFNATFRPSWASSGIQYCIGMLNRPKKNFYIKIFISQVHNQDAIAYNISTGFWCIASLV